MAEWRLIASGSVTFAQGEDGFIFPAGFATRITTETEAEAEANAAYTANDLFCYVSASTAPSEVRLRINQADATNLVISVTDSTTGIFEDTGGTADSISDQDEFNYELNNSVGHNESMTFKLVGVTLDAATAIFFAGLFQNVDSTNTIFFPLGGGGSFATRAHTQLTLNYAATLDHLRVYVSANASDMAGTLRTEINAADGNLSVSIGAAATGAFEDNSNTDSISSGDEVNYEFVGAGAGGMMSWESIACTSDSDERSLVLQGLPSGWSANDGDTEFGALEGALINQSTEVDTQVTVRLTDDFKNLFFYVSAYSLGSAATGALRQNGSNTALSVSLDGTGIFEDTTSTVTPADDDEFNYIVSAPAGSGSITIRLVAIEISPTVGPGADELLAAMQQTIIPASVPIPSIAY